MSFKLSDIMWHESSTQQLADAINRLVGTLETMQSASTGNGQASEDHQLLLPPSSNVEYLLAVSPIAPLLRDNEVNDILINGPYEIYVDRQGRLEKTELTFPDHEHLIALAEGIVHSIGRRIDPKRPLIDTRLHDGSRVNIIAPPMALAGIVISIRKFPQKEITLDTLVENNTITSQMAKFLALCAECRLNTLISGGTGAGKTTLLNAISRHISHKERIVTIEDTAELRLQQPHVVRLETKEPANAGNHTEEVNSRDLIRNALRMRPDRIIIGEIRGKEAYDMIQAMNTGHDGSMTTIHANSARDALTRLENMLAAAMIGTPVINIRRQIVSAIQIVIQVSRHLEGNGQRKVVSVSEIIGIEGDTPVMQEIFTIKQNAAAKGTSDEYSFEWCKVIPRHSRLAAAVRAAKLFTIK